VEVAAAMVPWEWLPAWPWLLSVGVLFVGGLAGVRLRAQLRRIRRQEATEPRYVYRWAVSLVVVLAQLSGNESWRKFALNLVKILYGR
jgi:hypothetical protein